MGVVVIGSGATDKGAADWNRTVMEPVSLGEMPVWGLDRVLLPCEAMPFSPETSYSSIHIKNFIWWPLFER